LVWMFIVVYRVCSVNKDSHQKVNLSILTLIFRVSLLVVFFCFGFCRFSFFLVIIIINKNNKLRFLSVLANRSK